MPGPVGVGGKVGSLAALLGLWGLEEVRLGQKYSWGTSRGSIRAYWTVLCLGSHSLSCYLKRRGLKWLPSSCHRKVWAAWREGVGC